SMAMILPSVIMLRRLAQSTNTFKGWALQKLHLSKGDRTRKPRLVWNNPIAWREARTKASAAKASVLRFGFIGLGLAGAVFLLVLHTTEGTAPQFTHGYLADSNTLFIDGANPREYKVSPDVQVKFGEADGTFDALKGRYAVDGDITLDAAS